MKRRAVFEMIEAERKFQSEKWDETRDVDNTDTDWVSLIGEEFGEYAKAVNEGDLQHAYTELVQMIALAVKVLEEKL